MTIEVKRLVLREMGEFNEQYARPYTPEGSGFSESDIDSLVESTESGTDITASSLAGVAGRFITPTADIARNLDDYSVDIPNGWNERRFAYLMEAIVSQDSNSSQHVLIMGYTDHADITASEQIAPDMRFYINSTINLNSILSFDPSSKRARSRWHTRMANNDQVLISPIDTGYSGVRNRRSLEKITMRPEDIFRRQSTSSIMSDMDHDGIIDKRHGFTEGALKLSRRGNSIANEYLANSIRAHHSSRNTADNFEDDYDTITINSARKSVRENMVSDNPLFDHLTDRTGLLEEGFVTYGELEDSFGDYIDNVTSIMLADPHQIASLDGSSYFDTATAEGMAAYIIANTLPKLLMECKYSGCEVNITNDTIDGRPDVRCVRINPFTDGESIDHTLSNFKQRLIIELFDDVSFRNRKVVSLKIDSQIWSETIVEISIDHDHTERYVFPTFSDALIAPVVGTDVMQLDQIGETIIDLSDRINDYSGSGSRRQEKKVEIYTGVETRKRRVLSI